MHAPLLTSQLPQQSTTPASITPTTLNPDHALQAASTVQSIDHPGHGTASFPAPLMATSTGSSPALIPKVDADPIVLVSSTAEDASNTIVATPVQLQTDITQGAIPAPITDSTSARELSESQNSGNISLT